MKVPELLEQLTDSQLRKQTEVAASQIGAVFGARITSYRILLEVFINERERRVMAALIEERRKKNYDDCPF